MTILISSKLNTFSHNHKRKQKNIKIKELRQISSNRAKNKENTLIKLYIRHLYQTHNT